MSSPLASTLPLALALSTLLTVPACAPQASADCSRNIVIGPDATEREVSALLAGCRVLDGNLTIERSSLRDLDLLGGLEHIGGNLDIWRNDQLTSTSGLSALASVDGEIVMAGNGALVDVDLPRLARAGGLSIYSSAAPTSLHGFDRLVHLDGELFLADLRGLSALSGFRALEEVGKVVVVGNPGLIEFDGFERLQRADFLALESNASMAELGGLGALETVGGSLLISNNATLQRISAFSSLERVGDVEISGNQMLCRSAAEELVEEAGAGAAVVGFNDDSC